MCCIPLVVNLDGFCYRTVGTAEGQHKPSTSTPNPFRTRRSPETLNSLNQQVLRKGFQLDPTLKAPL